MRILHICSYYIGNKLYRNLIKHLSFSGIEQEVFIPIRDKNHFGKNQLPSEFKLVNYYYRNILKNYDRILFHNKMNKQMKEIEKIILSNKTIDFIHAHTIFSDGGTAYKIYKKYGTNYIVNVRNTDINIFYKYGIHLRPLMYKILLNASSIVFISHAYKQKMFSILPDHICNKIRDKSYVIPNGIDDYWHDNAVLRRQFNTPNEINLLFIGRLDKNKNLGAVFKSCAKLYNEGFNISLQVVGKGPLENKYRKLCKELNIDKQVTFHGYITDKEQLSKTMDKCDIFVMPSFKETFGLVYIEAMSRGIPVIYTRGQGIDGFFKSGEVGFSVNPSDTDDIIKAIKEIKDNYNNISCNCRENVKLFKWDTITPKYRSLYK